jgi:succinate-acetate transporter protein
VGGGNSPMLGYLTHMGSSKNAYAIDSIEIFMGTVLATWDVFTLIVFALT